ncbi:MAG TPA: proton-conducting transporter membrane subunit [Candidatus Megaira endosymbiont of Nemacystus decipiens]|nr:proton-conducting transporter membrane subunit [Candidatus Megaera endosymbiont of Nemacystus decipiens]
MTIAHHIPILQIILPLFGGLLSALSFNLRASYFISLASVSIATISSFYFYKMDSFNEISYVVGNWPSIAGIEYKIDYLNQPLIIFINLVLLFFLIFAQKLTYKLSIKYIEESKQHIFYSFVLFAHAGYIGVVSTNDLFNLYVFIEICSLSTYVLMSIGSNRSAVIGAFDYLVLGTIGATLILIGIGFLLAITGNLNMTEVSYILNSSPYSRAAYASIGFIIVGILLKIAFLPMHFWMRRAYNNSSPIILSYFGAISGIFCIYIMTRFTHYVFDVSLLQQKVFANFINPAALISIIIGSFLAFRSSNMKEVIVYSTTAQIGYILLLFTTSGAGEILWCIMLIDAINKIALFTMISHIQLKTDDLSFKNFVVLHHSSLFKILVAIILLSSVGLPPLAMFFVKVRMLELLLNMEMNIEFLVVIFGSLLAILYNFKIARAIFSSSTSSEIHEDHHVTINKDLTGLMIITVVQVLFLFFMNNLLINFAY